jgi:NodT family efflux transporter outer membrane factor (OMF) lipoprotein
VSVLASLWVARAEALSAFLAGGLALALLAACTVGPNFAPPKSEAPKGYVAQNEAGLETGSATAVGQRVALDRKLAADWWAAFKSPELDRTMEQALAGNRDLETARANLAAAQETVAAAAGGELPQLSVGASVARQKINAQSFGLKADIPPFNLYSIGPNVSYTLDLFGGTRRLVEEKAAMAEVAGYRLEAARLALTGNVATEAFDIAAARAGLATVRDILKDDEENLKLVRDTFAAGAVTQVDVLSAESQLANDRTLMPPLDQRLSVARHALSILVGKAPADWTPPDFDLASIELPRDLPLSLPSALAHDRPDIRAAESELHAATAEVGIATAQLYPNITLSLSAGQVSNVFGHMFDGADTVWSLATGLTAPIFNGGTLEAEKRGAEDKRQAAYASYQQVVLISFGQVADTLQALAHDGELLQESERAAEIAGASLKLTRVSYNEGNTGVLQVLDAERALNEARLTTLRARVELYRDTAELFLALGGTVPATDSETQAAKP